MTKISRDDIKKRGLGRFVKSFGYSIEGLKYAYKYEQSMFVYVIFTVLVIAVNLFFKVDKYTWLLSLIAIGVVLAAELINTAIEAVVDLVTLEIHPLAKIAKDCGSAATFVLACMAATLGFIVYVPYIIDFIKGIF